MNDIDKPIIKRSEFYLRVINNPVTEKELQTLHYKYYTRWSTKNELGTFPPETCQLYFTGA